MIVCICCAGGLTSSLFCSHIKNEAGGYRFNTYFSTGKISFKFNK